MTQSKHDVEMISSTAKATYLLSLDPEDFDRVKRSGPLQVNFGGDFTSQTETVSVPSNVQTVTTYQYAVSRTFKVDGKDAAWNEQAAKDWMTDLDVKVTAAIGDIRTDDAALVGGLPTYNAI